MPPSRRARAALSVLGLAALSLAAVGLAGSGYRSPAISGTAGGAAVRSAAPAAPAAPEPAAFPVRLDLAGGVSGVWRGTAFLGDTPLSTELPAGRHELSLRRPGFADQAFSLEVAGPVVRTLRHQRSASRWRSVAVYPTGRQPKSVNYTPDGRYLVVALLDDRGFDLIDLTDGTARRYGPEAYAERLGFVETLMCPGQGTFWLSQMTTGRIFEYTLVGADPEPRLRRSLSARGSWTKVMAADPAYRWLAASNWLSSSVAVLDYATGEPVAELAGLAVPRGLAFAPDGRWLYVTSYEGAAFHKYATADWKRAASFVGPAGAAYRHVVLSADGSLAYVTDMHGRSVHVLETAGLTEVGRFDVDFNPNTIALAPDGRRLFVSCRGPNNPESYLLRSPRDGLVHVFNLATGLAEAVLEGGNQPTGLAVAPDGASFAFTSFLDDRVEIYAYDPELR